MGSDRGDDGLASGHANKLLTLLGYSDRVAEALDTHPALAWRRSGLMEVTGRPDGEGLVCPVPLTSAAEGALAALRALAPAAELPETGALLLGERARLLGLQRRGPVSPNGSCRLLETRAGRLALNLPRAEDWESLPALFGEPASDWTDVARLAAACDTEALVARGAVLGLAVAADTAGAIPAAPFIVEKLATPRAPRSAAPLVVDLSVLWAGPLAGSLLAMAHARVIKVESSRRPDGARFGAPAFYQLLNRTKESVSLDFASPDGRDTLRRLVAQADIVIESSRPRALAQLGIGARETAAQGATWVSITAHGREGKAGMRVGFGDDAAIAGGIGAAMRAAWGEALFAGDAIADPLTGITAALAGWAGWRAGGGCIISLPLARVVAHARGLGCAADIAEWQALACADRAPPYSLRSSS